jgi:uncharacterized protein YdhG (YjbR/CyaY superfamily)
MKTTTKYASVDDYLSLCPGDIRLKLEALRAAIQKAAPQAKEVISYKMPAYRQHGILVYFAAHKNHIGFYPTSSGVLAFQKELASYKVSKGAIQFALDKPLPLTLVARIVKFRVKEDREKG